ncbi:PspA/IM30 family protein [Cryomorphaceae bacterium 1068]|nr:PspA/IM30 family protein [Cryomorphaceae bacterium 1068]
MNLLRRLFSIGKAEANSAVDKLEDPIKMTEQGIRNLKQDLDKALHALAEVKALSIRSRNDVESHKEKAKDYEQKAILILQRAQKGELDVAEADRLASEALVKKEENNKHSERSKREKEKFDQSISDMDGNIKRLKQQISHYENELKTLKARVKVSSATKNINKQMAQLDSSGTVSMLERMKEKVAQEEALAESYGEIAKESRSVDEELDRAVAGAENAKAGEELKDLKKKLGMNKK